LCFYAFYDKGDFVMVDIEKIDKDNKTVTYDDQTTIDYKGFIDAFRVFMKGRIAGESLYPADMERFMRRTSGKNLSQLMKGKRHEGFLEAEAGKKLTRGQKIAIGSVVTVVFVVLIVFVVLRNQGIIPG
jgi:hypothetical protein